MGADTLVKVANGQVLYDDMWNQIKRGYVGDLLPRNSSTYLPEDLAGKMGTNAYTWDAANINQIYCDTIAANARSAVSGTSVDVSNNEILTNTESLTFASLGGLTGNLAMHLKQTYTIITDGRPIMVSCRLTTFSSASSFDYMFSFLSLVQPYFMNATDYADDLLINDTAANANLHTPEIYHISGNNITAALTTSSYVVLGGLLHLPAGTYNLYQYGCCNDASITLSSTMTISGMII